MLEQLLGRLQARFRFRERQSQLEAAQARKETDQQAWAKYLEDLQTWKQQCRKNTCASCGRKKHVGDCPDETDESLRAAIRCYAGINPKNNITPVYDADWLRGGGGAGFRVCDKGSWDNACRAAEDG